jgi:putative transposase
MSDRNDMQLVLDTVKKAKGNSEVKGTLLHSDQGFQYTSRTFTNQLTEFNMRPSMSRKGNCWDNACMESFFGHLKAECIYLHTFHTESELKQAIDQYIFL